MVIKNKILMLTILAGVLVPVTSYAWPEFVEKIRDNFRTPNQRLARAIATGNTQAAHDAIQEGADAHKNNAQLIIDAVNNNDKEMVRTLIQNLDQNHVNLQAGLNRAIHTRNSDIQDLLFDAGVTSNDPRFLQEQEWKQAIRTHNIQKIFDLASNPEFNKQAALEYALNVHNTAVANLLREGINEERAAQRANQAVRQAQARRNAQIAAQ